MHVLDEIVVVLGVSLFGEVIASLLPIKFPSSVVGMVLLLILLCVGALKTLHIEKMSGFLLSNMAVLFVPAGVSVLKYADVVMENIAPILLISILTTPIVYAATAWSVKLSIHLINKKGSEVNA